MTKKKETRTFDITNVEKRDGENQSLRVSGYAAVFNSKTSIGEYFDEMISPGAFSRTLSENGDIRALINHNFDKLIGRTKSGTLILSEDERGLKFEIDLPNTTYATDLAVSMERGDINQCSFGFYATEESWDYSIEPALRTVNEAELFEISIVSIPAYENTEAALVRSKEIDEFVEKRIKLLNQIKGVLENEN
ncbi:HK97 family phage prohead protease [Cytobacillus sp. FSL M8-0252]|uniref:HK97 family phage prohead protease n=1 Tax=Cytobacillus sp. FSL M8-0252 TaxID=2921621 RepID=UPI0030FBADD5